MVTDSKVPVIQLHYVERMPLAGVFYYVKNGSSFITSKSSSKNLRNQKELAF